MSVLQTRNLSIGYQNKAVAHNLNLDLRAGEVVCLLGPNGAGKSTLMRTLAGLQEPLTGAVIVSGGDISQMTPAELAKHMSIVTTERPYVGMMTGYALVALGRNPHTGWIGRRSAQDEAVIQWAIEAVHADDLARSAVMELSDGQQQKLMIARALAQQPSLVLLDEPTAFLDLPHRADVMRLLRTLSRQTQQAVLVSTHDLELALRTADQFWLMAADGSIRTGAPEDLILSGAFESVFAGDGIEFDRQNGFFKLSTPQFGAVHVHGQGTGATWTRRALERAGYRVASNRTEASLDVTVLEGPPVRWRLTQETVSCEYDRIYDLLQDIQRSAIP